jgi:hypothetical protein
LAGCGGVPVAQSYGARCKGQREDRLRMPHDVFRDTKSMPLTSHFCSVFSCAIVLSSTHSRSSVIHTHSHTSHVHCLVHAPPYHIDSLVLFTSGMQRVPTPTVCVHRLSSLPVVLWCRQREGERWDGVRDGGGGEGERWWWWGDGLLTPQSSVMLLDGRDTGSVWRDPRLGQDLGGSASRPPPHYRRDPKASKRRQVSCWHFGVLWHGILCVCWCGGVLV